MVGLALWLEQGQHRADGAPAAPATTRRRLYGTVTALRAAGVTVPASASQQANNAMVAYERRLAQAGARRGRGKAPAATVKQLRSLCAELLDTVAGNRDRDRDRERDQPRRRARGAPGPSHREIPELGTGHRSTPRRNDPHVVATQGGWAGDSAVLHDYMRIVDQWGDNALQDIGL